MLEPTIDNILKDEQRGITYIIKAYGVITYEEKVIAIRHYHAQKPKPKVKKGATVIINTAFGRTR